MSSPVLYGLDRRDAELLQLEFGYEDLHWYANMKELKDEFLEHTCDCSGSKPKPIGEWITLVSTGD
jgi:hypothetical protein